MQTTHWYEIARRIAKRKRITYADIAARIGVSDGAVGHYMVGRRRASLEVIRKIAVVLEVPLMTLVEDDLDVARTQEEARMLEVFRSIPPEKQDLALKLLAQLTEESGRA